MKGGEVATSRTVILQQGVQLAPWTTLQIGGACDYFAEVSGIEELSGCLQWAEAVGVPVFFLGSGSNVLFSDAGFRGLLLRNRMRGLEIDGATVEVAGGEDLGELILQLNSAGLAGMECMYGIPGTVAGAVVGNAGAYGQEIGERVLDVDVWEMGRIRRIKTSRLGFGYRRSRFRKRSDWFLLSCRLRLEKSSKPLQKISDEILSRRLGKYPQGLRCPGSLFKNLLVSELPLEVLRRIPEGFVQYGKIPAGMLLEAVGGKGERCGGARVADYHANLFINDGQASASDLIELAKGLAERVRLKFGVALEPEVRIVGDEEGCRL